MTELQWLIKMLTQHKLPKGVKDLFIERLGEVEGQLAKGMNYNRPAVFIPGPQAQAPSTIAAMERQMAEPLPMPPVVPPLVTQRIVGGEVNTGNGTRGPRKF